MVRCVLVEVVVGVVVVDRHMWWAVYKNSKHVAIEWPYQRDALSDSEQCQSVVARYQVSRPTPGGLRWPAIDGIFSCHSYLHFSVTSLSVLHSCLFAGLNCVYEDIFMQVARWILCLKSLRSRCCLVHQSCEYAEMPCLPFPAGDSRI